MFYKYYQKFVRLIYPWPWLFLTLGRILILKGVDRDRAVVRFWRLVLKLDFAGLVAMAIEMGQPIYWV